MHRLRLQASSHTCEEVREPDSTGAPIYGCGSRPAGDAIPWTLTLALPNLNLGACRGRATRKPDGRRTGGRMTLAVDCRMAHCKGFACRQAPTPVRRYGSLIQPEHPSTGVGAGLPAMLFLGP